MASLALSHEEARCSGLVMASPEAHDDALGLIPSLALVAAPPEVSSGPILEGSPPQRLVSPSGLQDAAASSCPSNKDVFRHPFDLEARMMKILGDLLPVEGEGLVSKCKKFLPDVWRELLELEERIRLIDGCASGEEYRYHVLGQYSRFPVERPLTQDQFRTPSFMEEEEHQKIIAAGKHPKETVRRQQELEEEWKLMEETSVKAWSIARRRMEAEREKCGSEGMVEGKRCFFLQLIEMGRRAHRAEARREEAEKAAVSLRSALDAERADLKVTRDNAEGILLSKRNLNQALASAEGEVEQDQEKISKLLSKIDILRAERDEAIRKAAAAEQDQEKISRLLSEIDILQAKWDEAIKKAVVAEDRALRSLAEPPTLASGVMSPLAHDPGEGSSLGEKALVVREPMTDLNQEEPRLLEGSEPSRVEVVWLPAKLKVLRAECSQAESAKGGGSLPMGSTWSSSASVIVEYLRRDAYQC
ncbi:hypothetical protein ACLOJK_006051 [Asimina triloba]